MKVRGVHAIIAVSLLASAPVATGAQKPKYGPEATPLSESHEYVGSHAAPDFWALMPFYVGQQTGAACSIASVTMVVNAARGGRKLSADEAFASQDSVLKKVDERAWKRATGKLGRGVTLDQLGPWTLKALEAHGFDQARVETVHVSGVNDAERERLRRALLENEKSSRSFMIVNFIQGVLTGDAPAGHVSPIAAYDAERRQVLVLDPDREYYEPYWVSEDALLAAMATRDPVAGQNRGYLLIDTGAAPEARPPLQLSQRARPSRLQRGPSSVHPPTPKPVQSLDR